jgi:hypothetical protein
MSKITSEDEARKMGEAIGAEVAEFMIHPERATLEDVRTMAFNLISMSVVVMLK